MHGLPITLRLEGPTKANVLPNCGILQEISTYQPRINLGGKLTWIQALCEQYAKDPPKRTEPSVLRMSPISPWSNDVFPEPTAPTIAKSCPRGTLEVNLFQLEQTLLLDFFRFRGRLRLRRAATVLLLSLPLIALIRRRTVPHKRCIFNFQSVLGVQGLARMFPGK